MSEIAPFRSVTTEKLSEQISRQLLERIIAGRYKPGDLLPPELHLANFSASAGWWSAKG
jgi:DNA-binding FadR family transcriptional regulator